MFKELKFALYAIKKNIQSSAELRTSFLMNIFGMAINNISFIILWVFFVKSVGVIGGWTAMDIVGLQGFLALCYGIICSIGGGIKKLAEYTASGVFDRFMLSPKNLLVRIATATFGVSAVGDIVFGTICLIVYAFFLPTNISQIILIILLVFITSIIFLSVMILIYSTSFFFTEASYLTNGFFELFLTPSMFHGGVFQGATRFIFTFIIPSLLVGSIPVEIVRDISFDKFLLISLLALFWFILSIKIFNKAVRRYESANFMTFGG
jgi:ABC-2 type transport system permease protein